MPPLVKRVTTHPPANGPPPKATPGSILSRAVSVAQLKSDFMRVVTYGENRVGKTTFAAQFPKPMLIASFEPGGQAGGAVSVKNVQGIQFIAPTSTDEAVALAREMCPECPFQCVVVDTATSLQDTALKEILGLDDIPVQLNWGTVSETAYRERSEKTKAVLQQFMKLRCHLVVTAQERDHNPPQRTEGKGKLTRGMQVESKFAADLGQATVKWLHDCCDFILHMYIVKEIVTQKRKETVGGRTEEFEDQVETGKLARRIRTMYHPNFAAGIRSANPEKVPEYIEDRTPAGMYRKFMSVVKGE